MLLRVFFVTLTALATIMDLPYKLFLVFLPQIYSERDVKY